MISSRTRMSSAGTDRRRRWFEEGGGGRTKGRPQRSRRTSVRDRCVGIAGEAVGHELRDRENLQLLFQDVVRLLVDELERPGVGGVLAVDLTPHLIGTVPLHQLLREGSDPCAERTQSEDWGRPQAPEKASEQSTESVSSNRARERRRHRACVRARECAVQPLLSRRFHPQYFVTRTGVT
jgi:hypothetical protein